MMNICKKPLTALLLFCMSLTLVSCNEFFEALFGEEDNPTSIQGNSGTPSSSEKQMISMIAKEYLNGWDGGFYRNSLYYLYKESEDGSDYYLNSTFRNLEEGLLLHLDENGVPSYIVYKGKYYSLLESDSKLTILSLGTEGISVESVVIKQKASTRAIIDETATFILNHFVRGIDTIDDIIDGVSIFQDFRDRLWGDFLIDILETGLEIAAGTFLGPEVSVAIAIGFNSIEGAIEASAQRNSNIIYESCKAEISGINKGTDGKIEVYVTVNNANTMPQYIKRNYSPETVEETRNNVFCGVVGRSVGLPTTQYYTKGYKSDEVEIPTDGSVSTLYLSFFLPDVPSGQTYSFRPYLRSTRIKNIFGGVDQGYIRYGEIVRYGGSAGTIVELNTTSSSCSTDEGGNVFVSFNSWATAMLNSTDGVNDWGVFVDNGTGSYDEKYATGNNTSVSGFINIPFNINKNEFSENIDYNNFIARKTVKLGVYRHLNNPTGNYDYLYWYYSDPQEFELVYDKKPVIKTLDCVSSEKTSAVIKCQYENAIFWGGNCGIEYGYDNNKVKLVVFPTDDSEMKINLTELTSDKEYSYRAYYEINGKTIYGDYKSFSTGKEETNGLCPDNNHPHMIDLGLPSGTKWACCNVGASKPEEVGGFYFFEEANTMHGPSEAQARELYFNCPISRATINGVIGCKMKGPNGNSVFFPINGKYFPDNSYEGAFSAANLWCSYTADGYCLHIDGGSSFGGDNELCRMPVRLVSK